jgi:hypothetical protein
MFRSNSADTVSATIDDLGSILGDKYVRKHGHVQKAISTIFTRAFATSNPSAWGVGSTQIPGSGCVHANYKRCCCQKLNQSTIWIGRPLPSPIILLKWDSHAEGNVYWTVCFERFQLFN